MEKGVRTADNEPFPGFFVWRFTGHIGVSLLFF